MKSNKKQIAAEQSTTQNSTEPAANIDKAVASGNTFKHGLLAKEIVVDGGDGAEDRQELDRLMIDLKNQFKPQGALEEILVEKIAVAYWRLRRAHRYEVGQFRKKMENATDNYYRGVIPGTHERRMTDEQIDAAVIYTQQHIKRKQSDKVLFAQMRSEGKDLKEIYDRSESWAWVRDKAIELGDKLPGKSPEKIRGSLNKVEWKDEDIWQFHIEACDDAIKSDEQKIPKLYTDKENNKLALQVLLKTGSIPDVITLNQLLKYEGPIEKQFYKAISQLERLQRLRAGEPVPAPISIDLNVNTEHGS